VALLAALTGWIALSAAWGTPDRAGAETERALLYVAAAAAAAALLRRRVLVQFVAGALLGLTALTAFALATRLFPGRLPTHDDIAVNRLAEPVGYWNALGILCVIGITLAVGLAARARTARVAAAVAATLPVFAATLFFTFSRGGWIALAVAACAAVAFDPRRLQLAATFAVALPALAAAAFLSSRSQALTHVGSPLSLAAHDGKRLAVEILILAALTACAVGGLRSVERVVHVSSRVRRAAGIVLVAVVLTGAVGAFARAGGPVDAFDRVRSAFTAPPPKIHGNLNRRLFTLSGNGRVELWRAAWHDARAHPLLGSGSGTYEASWLAHRPVADKVRDAHSLYLETLAELGPLGLILLLGALAVPLVAAASARRHPLAPALFGAYVAFLVHAAFDWDWEMPVVTTLALFCGVGLCVAARSDDDERAPSRRLRTLLCTAATCVGALSFVGLVGSLALAHGDNSARQGRWAQAERDARSAAQWQPWSAQPRQALGEAQLAEGDVAGARGSFRTAIGKDPGNWELWLDLARASTGAAGEHALAQASALNPLSPEIAELRTELGASGREIVVRS